MRPCEQWKSVAKEFRDFQSGRRRFERLINQSPSHVVGSALGVPFVAAVLFFLFGWQFVAGLYEAGRGRGALGSQTPATIILLTTPRRRRFRRSW